MTSEWPDGECCVGDPGFGDPHGMHSYDCPVYQASNQMLLDRRIKQEEWRKAMDLATSDVNAALNLLGPPPEVGASTSERLRQTQADLAASQADLTRMERALAEALEMNARLAVELATVSHRLTLAEKEPCGWRGLAEKLMRERDQEGNTDG